MKFGFRKTLAKSQQIDNVSVMLQETTWTVPEAVAAKADALKLTPEKAAIVRMLKANKTVAANLRADLRGEQSVQPTASDETPVRPLS
jgi:hypothetical protein